MKKLILIALLISISASCFSQDTGNSNKSSQYLLRSTVGVNGFSTLVKTNSQSLFIQQSVGQASVIGTHSNNNFTARQGFLQPLNSAMGISIEKIENNLNAIVYPNPFYQSVNISFSDVITDDLFVSIYNMSGGIVFVKKYSASQQIDIPLSYLSEEIYMLKIRSENKKLIQKLIKR